MDPTPSRRDLLATAGAAAGLGLAGCSALRERLPTGGATTGTPTSTRTPDAETPTPRPKIEPADGPVAGVDALPAEGDYAALGSADAPVTATLYGAWKCPYTRKFVNEGLPPLVEAYVAAGDVALRFRAVAYRDGEPFHGPDEPRAARGGLAVWNADPESFPAYFATVFANQPDKDRRWATTDGLLRFAEAAGVSNLGDVEAALGTDEYAPLVDRTMESVETVPPSRRCRGWSSVRRWRPPSPTPSGRGTCWTPQSRTSPRVR